MKLEEAAIDFLGDFLWVFQNLCDSGLSDTILSWAETNTFPWCTRCWLQPPNFQRHLGWLSWEQGNVQARERNEGIGNYRGESKCSTVLELGRNHNMTLEIIIRMSVTGLREWGRVPLSIQCVDQSEYSINKCWLNISAKMCIFGVSSESYARWSLECQDGVLRKDNANC